MKICADENLSVRLVSVVNELSSNMPLLLHVRDIKANGVPDRIWVRNFAETGGEAIISGDFAMTNRPAELIALGETGLKLIVLPTAFVGAGILRQTAYTLMWWPKIVEILRGAPTGSYVKLPWNMNMPRISAWQKIDIASARQRWKKSTRPSRTKSPTDDSINENSVE